MATDAAKRGVRNVDHRLSDEDVAAFKRDGFVVVRGMYREQAEQLQQWVSEISAWPEVPGKYAMYFEDSLREPGTRILNRVEQFIEYHDGFRELLTSAPISPALPVSARSSSRTSTTKRLSPWTNTAPRHQPRVQSVTPREPLRRLRER